MSAPVNAIPLRDLIMLTVRAVYNEIADTATKLASSPNADYKRETLYYMFERKYVFDTLALYPLTLCCVILELYFLELVCIIQPLPPPAPRSSHHQHLSPFSASYISLLSLTN